MVIRLLPKSEIDKAKALDRQREIEEGKKLADRVDTLRRTHAEEEAELTRFRSTTLSQLQQDIDAKIRENDALTAKLAERREELLHFTGPLERQWLKYLDTEKKTIDALRAEADKAQQEAARQLIAGQKLLQDNQTEQARLAFLKEQHQANVIRSKELVAEGQQAVLEGQSTAAKLKADATRIVEAARSLENEFHIRAANLKLKEEALARKEQEVEDRELAALAKELLYYSPVKKNPNGNTI